MQVQRKDNAQRALRPAIQRTMPLIIRGTRMHTILSRIFPSPPFRLTFFT